MTRISILLAVHNGEAYLDQAIRSVQAQTHTDWELLVVSNGSTDGTVAIAERIASSDPRIRVMQLPNPGKNAAYNVAFAHSTGAYVCFFAADDVLPAESLAERLAPLDGAPQSGFSTCCLRTISTDAKYNGLVFPKRMTKPNYSGGAMLFPRSLAEEVFPLPEQQPNEDTWTLLHLQAFGDLRHVPKALYLYRIHGANSYGYGLSFEQKREKYLHRMRAYRLFYEKYANGNGPALFLRNKVLPFLKGLAAADSRNVPKILLVRGLDLGSKLVLIFYCSKTLYTLRHAFFRKLSGGVAH